MNTFYWFFTLIVIFSVISLLYKKGWYPKSYSPWKLFGGLVSLGAIAGICYGGYFLVNYLIPPKSERLFKKIITNQIEVQTKYETGNLEKMAGNSGTNTLSPDELKLAQKNRLDADKKRKKLEAMLNKPEEKIAPPKPATWIFQIKAEPKTVIMARGKGVDQAPLTEFNLIYFSQTDKELRFKYHTSKGSLVDILLDKEKADDTHYFGMADLPDPPKGRKMMLWLKNNENEFEGTTVTWDGARWYPTVSAFLKKS